MAKGGRWWREEYGQGREMMKEDNSGERKVVDRGRE